MKLPKLTVGFLAANRLIESIMELMSKKGVSQADLARERKSDPSTVSKWFSKGRNLTVFTAAMIADALDADLEIRVVERLHAVAQVPTSEDVRDRQTFQQVGQLVVAFPQPSDEFFVGAELATGSAVVPIPRRFRAIERTEMIPCPT